MHPESMFICIPQPIMPPALKPLLFQSMMLGVSANGTGVEASTPYCSPLENKRRSGGEGEALHIQHAILWFSHPSIEA